MNESVNRIPGRKKRLAAIDLGTNSARLLVADLASNASMEPVTSHRFPCRLGEGLVESGRISDAAAERTAEALRHLTQKARICKAERIVLCATQALRQADNGKVVKRLLEEACQQPIYILTGEQEASLVFNAARRRLVPRASVGMASFDLGGGSLEFAYQADGHADVLTQSLTLGAVVMASGLEQDSPVGSEDLRRFREEVAVRLCREAPSFADLRAQLVGAGGSVTTAAALQSTPAADHLGRQELEALLLRVAGMTPAQRQAHEAIADRYDIIVGGLAIVCETLSFLGSDQVHVLHDGIREGILLAMLDGDL